MKEVFQRPSKNNVNVEEVQAVINEVVTEKDEYVDFDTYNSTGIGHKFPKTLSSVKAKSTYDVVDQLLKKMAVKGTESTKWSEEDAKVGVSSEPASTSTTTKSADPRIVINLADFTVASLTFPLKEMKDKIVEDSLGAVQEVIQTKSGGLMAVIKPELILITKDDEEDSLLNDMKQDVESKLSLENLPSTTQAILASSDIVAINDEQLAVSIDVRKALTACVLTNKVITNNSFWDEEISVSRIIEIKDGRINFAIRSEVTGMDGCQSTMSIHEENLVAINICMTDERFRSLASKELLAIDPSFKGIRFVKTVDVVKTMSIPEKALQYLIGISQDTPVNYIPLIEFSDNNYIENMKKVNNELLAEMLTQAGTKSFDTNEILKSYSPVLDSDMIYLANVNGNVCIVPNLRKLGHLVTFGNILPTTTFRSSVTTNSNSLAFVFTI